MVGSKAIVIDIAYRMSIRRNARALGMKTDSVQIATLKQPDPISPSSVTCPDHEGPVRSR